MTQKERTRSIRLAFVLLSILLLTAGCGGAREVEQQAPEAPVGGSTEQEQTAAPKGPVKAAIKPLPGYQAPNFKAQDAMTGETFSLADLRGQVVFLNFWATWCPPCKAEMPEMEALHQEMGDKVRIIALGADATEKPEKLVAFAKAMDLSFQVAWDGGVAAEAYRVTGIPTSYFIDAKGVIRARYPGPMNLEQMKQFVEDASKEAESK